MRARIIPRGSTTRRRWAVTALIVACAATAAVVYLAVLPGVVASNYKDGAEPAHRRIERAMARVYASFAEETFGTPTRAYRRLDRIEQPARYTRAARGLTASGMADLRRSRAAVARARGVLAASRRDVVDFESWPGHGSLAKAEAAARLAGDEREYVERAASHLDAYEALLRYEVERTKLLGVSLVAQGHGLRTVSLADERALAAGLRRIAARLERPVTRLITLEPPAPARRIHRDTLRGERLKARRLRRAATAIRELDVRRLRAIERRMATAAKKDGRAAARALETLVTDSELRRAVDELIALERRIDSQYARL